MRKSLKLIFFMLLFITSLIITVSYSIKQQNSGWNVFHADGGGYYCYLPTLFCANFNPELIPLAHIEKIGASISIDTIHNTIQTKYYYGTALMQSPFFLATHIIATVFQIPEENGFARIYELMIHFAASFYLVLGLFILEKFLVVLFRPLIRYSVILLLFAGTNLYYVTLMSPSMSHVYSFFTFSLFLWTMQKFLDSQHWKWFLLLSASLSLSMIIRPVNGIILLFFFFWQITSLKDIFQRFRLFFRPANFITFTICLILFFIPQVCYWKYAWGSYVVNSYKGEGFINLAHPYLMEVWFAPKNGLFTNTPIVLFMIGGLIIMIWNKIKSGWIISVLFFLVSYLTASWWAWEMGCGLGHRAFVEFYAILSIPLGYFLTWIFQNCHKILTIFVVIILIFLCYCNILTAWSFSGCFNGDTWNFNRYLVNVIKAGVYPGKIVLASVDHSFESKKLKNNATNTINASSSLEVHTWNEFISGATKDSKDFDFLLPNKVEVTCKVRVNVQLPTYARFVFSVERNDKPLVWQSVDIDPMIKSKGAWYHVQVNFKIPEWALEDVQLFFCKIIKPRLTL